MLRPEAGPGTPLTRGILFFYEDGTWMHSFTQVENKFYVPDESFEEFGVVQWTPAT
jgi:hypothetical protein